jgi:hypothetical protein
MGITEENPVGIINKVINQISIWRPFNLSLPGRISIAKSMLYSQINYLGCFMPLSEETVAELDNLIINFVKGNLNIARKRMYQQPENGGLGLFDLKNFLDAQKCAWIKRSHDLSEPWKIILYVSNYGNLYNVKESNINMFEYPICHSISKSFENFTDMFAKHNENFRDCYIFDSKIFTLGLESKEHLNCSHFDNLFFAENSAKLYKLRYSNFYNNQGNIIESDEIREITGLLLTELQIYMCRGKCKIQEKKT